MIKSICRKEKKKEKINSARTGTRTLDPQIKSLMLYRLSYPGDGNHGFTYSFLV